MDTAQKHAINLSVLKRYDSSITTIIESSSHVVVYNFEPSLQTWVIHFYYFILKFIIHFIYTNLKFKIFIDNKINFR